MPLPNFKFHLPSCVKSHVVAAVVLGLASVTTEYGILATLPLVFVISNMLGNLCFLYFTELKVEDDEDSTSLQTPDAVDEEETRINNERSRSQLRSSIVILEDSRDRFHRFSVSSDVSDISFPGDPQCDLELTPREQTLQNEGNLQKLYGDDCKKVFGGVDCTFSIPSKVDDALTRLLDVTFDKVFQYAKPINGECVDVEMECKHLTRYLWIFETISILPDSIG